MAQKFHLRPEEKLTILQKADGFRKWYSLDDGRICVLCDRFITGRQIRVTRDKRGGYHLHCPTETCRSTPHEWMYAGNALLSDHNDFGLWEKIKKPLQRVAGFRASSDK
ncbi:MAG: hypothetical protein QOI04_834 [Verrucomicrobiota bacterium]